MLPGMSTLTGSQPVGPFTTLGSHAAAMLAVSEDAVAAMVTTGALDGAFVGGVLRVDADKVLALVYAGAAGRVEARELARQALRLYLDERPATAAWEVARAEGRPLACPPPGPPGQSRRWHQHAVVVRSSAVLGHAMRRCDDYPEFHGLPVAPTLGATLCMLPGVKLSHHAVPLDRVGGDHRLTGWLRLDQARWPARPDALVTALLSGAPS